MSNAILTNRKATILTNVSKSQKISCSLDDLHVNDYQGNRRTETGILYLVSHDIQELGQGPTELRK